MEMIAASMIDAQTTAGVPNPLHAHQYARRVAADLRGAGAVTDGPATTVGRPRMAEHDVPGWIIDAVAST
ncbi:hypothetical protein ACBR40_04855 [Nonomuraea sp. AD125B]